MKRLEFVDGNNPCLIESGSMQPNMFPDTTSYISVNKKWPVFCLTLSNSDKESFNVYCM